MQAPESESDMDKLAAWVRLHGLRAAVVVGPRGQRMVAVTSDVWHVCARGEGATPDAIVRRAGTETTLVGTLRDARDLLGY